MRRRQATTIFRTRFSTVWWISQWFMPTQYEIRDTDISGCSHIFLTASRLSALPLYKADRISSIR
jgi:hypothetical protein